MSNNTQIAEITPEELTKAENNMLTHNQLSFLLAKTPKNHIYSRPAKGGGTWNYVTGTYIKKVLNLMFGWQWSFKVIEHKFDLHIKQAYVLGELSVTSQGQTIVKMQFGRVDIKFKNEPAFNADGTPKMAKTRDGKEYQVKEPGTIPLDLGNDLKAATTDALKKCAAELGIASDVYAPQEFKEVYIISAAEAEEEREKELSELFAQSDTENMKPDDVINIQRIIDKKEKASYKKAIKLIKDYQK